MSIHRVAILLAPLLICPLAVESTAQGPAVAETVPALAEELAAPEEFISTNLDVYSAGAAAASGPACNCPDCQKKAAAKKAADLKKAIAGAYKPLFYDNNFAYINNPAYDECFCGDSLKQMQWGDCWTVDMGGQYRARYQGERNFRGFGLTGVDDDFLLHRTRLFMNAKYGDNLRFYGEYLDAESNYENFPSRAIEVNRSDMLNLFGDWKFFEGPQGDLTFRMGRQELLYGNQRLISPLDWANTRRTFDGAKFLWVGEDWNIDAFYTRPVTVNPKQFDSGDYEQEFFGTYATYKAIKDHTFDLYYLRYNNGRGANDFRFNTVGGRMFVTDEEWLYEAEGGAQFGENTGGSDHAAGFAMGGVGRKWAEHEWKPTLWANYDWASGGNAQAARRGFDHLFPLGHKYLGFMDLYGRSNINTPNTQLTFQPHEKLSVLVWYYYFFLDRIDDTPYNVNMTPFAPGVAPGSRDLGHELDLVFTYTLNPRMEVLFGYSHFFAGQYYETPGLPHNGDADFFYTHYQWNF
jgi:hypothetical protein